MLSNKNKIKLMETFNLQNIQHKKHAVEQAKQSDDEQDDEQDEQDDEVVDDEVVDDEVVDDEQDDEVVDDEVVDDELDDEVLDEQDDEQANPLTLENRNIKVCIYKIDEGLYPFTMFLLFKHDNNDLNFFKVEQAKQTGDILNILNTLFADQKPLLEYKGFLEEDDTLVIVVKWSQNKYKIGQSISPAELHYWVLPSEILNNKYVMNLVVNPWVTSFLTKHNKLYLIYDNHGDAYELPEIGYYGNYYKKVASVASLGLNRESIYSTIGPFYYFTDYTTALHNACWSPDFKPKKIGGKYITVDERGRYEKGGIVRFALFTGKTKVLTHDKDTLTNDKDTLTNDKDTLTNEYDSFRIGSGPLIALKEYEQQTPLEYYFVDPANV
jgi:hypothetical protein